MTSRKSEISLLNILMCMLVILVHVISWTLGDMDKSSVQYGVMLLTSRLSQFVVQGFIFLSAVKLFSSKKETSYEEFLFGRYKRVVLPYILWVVVYYVYFVFTYGYTFTAGKLLEYLIFGTACSHFYFVIIIMQFYLNMPVFKWLFKKVNPWLLCILAVAVTAFFKQYAHFQYDDRVLFAYLCYFAIGAAVGRNYEKVKACLKQKFYLAAILFVLFAFLDGGFTYRAQVHGITFEYIELVHIAYCIFATLFFFGLFALIADGKRLPKFLALVDRASYSIYLSHVIFIYIANALAERLEIFGMTEKLLFRGAFTYIITLGSCMAFAYISEKIKNGKQNSLPVSESA